MFTWPFYHRRTKEEIGPSKGINIDRKEEEICINNSYSNRSYTAQGLHRNKYLI
jgi:hypothetical protein